MNPRAFLCFSLFLFLFGSVAFPPAFASAPKPDKATTIPSGVSAPSHDTASRRDRRFIVGVLKINHDETIIAQLVAERASTCDVKLLARQIISDLSGATRDLRALADKKNILLPEPRSETGDLKAWNEKDPATVDVAYVDRVRDVLEELTDLYETAAGKSTDPEIAAYAQKILPAVREQHARALTLAPVLP